MFTIIDRYLAKSFLLYAVAGLIVFTAIYFGIDYTSTSMRFHASTDVMLQYYKYYLPIIVYQLIPIGGMIGTMFTLATLNRNNELMALYSLGHSLTRVSLPILSMVTLICIFTYWVGDHVVPYAAQKMSYVYYVDLEKTPGLYSTVEKNKIWYRSENTIFNISYLNAVNKSAQGITLYYFNDAWDLVQVIKAKTVKMNKKTWYLHNGTVTLFAKESSFPLTKSFRSKTLTVGEDLADFSANPPDSQTLTTSQLKNFIHKNKEAGMDTLGYEVDLYAKMSFAFVGLVLSLMGIPFTLQRARAGGNMLNIGLSVGIAFVYWVFYSASLAMGKHGVLPPFVAAWGPNILMGGAATAALVRLKR